MILILVFKVMASVGAFCLVSLVGLIILDVVGDVKTRPNLSNVGKKTHSLGGGMNCFGRCKSMC